MSTDQYGTGPVQHESQGAYPAAQQPMYAQPQQVFVQTSAPGNGLGVAGFVTGLLGLIFCWVPGLGIVLAVLGVIMGGVGIATGKRKGAPIGLAIAGLVLGVIALIPAIVIMSAVASVGASL
jgi:hypothetical protein